MSNEPHHDPHEPGPFSRNVGVIASAVGVLVVVAGVAFWAGQVNEKVERGKEALAHVESTEQKRPQPDPPPQPSTKPLRAPTTLSVAVMPGVGAHNQILIKGTIDPSSDRSEFWLGTSREGGSGICPNKRIIPMVDGTFVQKVSYYGAGLLWICLVMTDAFESRRFQRCRDGGLHARSALEIDDHRSRLLTCQQVDLPSPRPGPRSRFPARQRARPTTAGL